MAHTSAHYLEMALGLIKAGQPTAVFEGEMSSPSYLKAGETFTYKFSARADLFVIRQAREQGCDFEAEADGFGTGFGTMGGDWSGIRDSSELAKTEMLGKALLFFASRRINVGDVFEFVEASPWNGPGPKVGRKNTRVRGVEIVRALIRVTAVFSNRFEWEATEILSVTNPLPGTEGAVKNLKGGMALNYVSKAMARGELRRVM